ncbi:hypothetical protein [Streptomyces sp. NPDC048350]|uniref:hypothetical protein n=1 Tax=Streptomyces sp. NPDC048350 TaxID=3365538 RepID=UPI00371F81AE
MTLWRARTAAGLVGEITVTGGDFPWLHGHFTPGPAYDTVKDLFVRELALLEPILEGPDDHAAAEAWESAYDAVRSAVTLESPDGVSVPEFLLHIEGPEAWFRWSPEPFED